MAFGVAGAAAGSADALQDMLVRRRAEFLQQQQLQLQQEAAQRAAAAQAMQREQFEYGKTQDATERKTANAKIIADLVGPGQELGSGQAAEFAGTPYAALLESKQTLPSSTIAAAGGAQQGDPGGRTYSVLKPTQAQAEVAGQKEKQRQIVGLVKRGAPRNDVLSAMVDAGQELTPAALNDPNQAHTNAVALENLRNQHELGQINAQGVQNRQTAGVRTAGTRDAASQRRIDAKAKGFDSQPVVKRVQTVAEGALFAKSLNPNTTNPADDQALIYAFAKAMDPDSVVREGEYATVQKYAQSWAQTFGFDTARMFQNTPFLTAQARQNMKTTIMTKYQAARGLYDNLRKSYSGQLSGMGGDENDLIDYAAGFSGLDEPQTPPPGAPGRAGGAGPVVWGRDANGRPVPMGAP